MSPVADCNSNHNGELVAAILVVVGVKTTCLLVVGSVEGLAIVGKAVGYEAGLDDSRSIVSHCTTVMVTLL